MSGPARLSRVLEKRWMICRKDRISGTDGPIAQGFDALPRSKGYMHPDIREKDPRVEILTCLGW